MSRPRNDDDNHALSIFSITFLCGFYVAYTLIGSVLPCNRFNSDGYERIPLWRSSRNALMYLDINPLTIDPTTANADSSNFNFALPRIACPEPILKVPSRNHFGHLLAKENKHNGIEIGVRDGDYAARLLSDWSTAKVYHAVDLWQHQESYDDVSNANNTVHENRLETTKRRLRIYEQRGVDIIYHRKYSSQAVHEIPDLSLDFAYHDARHDYAGLMEDLVAYWPKMRTGAIIAGHDYLDTPDLYTPSRLRWGRQNWSVNMDGSVTPGGKAVRGAVDDFARRVGRQVVVCTADIEWPTWYLRK